MNSVYKLHELPADNLIPFPLAQGFIVFRLHVWFAPFTLTVCYFWVYQIRTIPPPFELGFIFRIWAHRMGSREALPPGGSVPIAFFCLYPFRSPNFTVHIQGPTPKPAQPMGTRDRRRIPRRTITILVFLSKLRHYLHHGEFSAVSNSSWAHTPSQSDALYDWCPTINIQH